jgi:type II secretory pathway pseudopilin PulG
LASLRATTGILRVFRGWRLMASLRAKPEPDAEIGQKGAFFKGLALDRKSTGYTLIELTVVIFLIGLTLALTVPRFRASLLTDNLKKTVRRVVGTVRTLRNDAIREHKVYRLHFDLASNRVWADSADMTEEGVTEARDQGLELPEGVRIMDVWRSNAGKETGGEATIHFSTKGYIEPSAIHLEADDGRQVTLVLSPFLGRVKVFEKYVEFVETS